VKFKSIKVSAVADPILGGTPKRSESRYWGGDIKWASAKDVAQTSSRYITETLETITEEGVKHSAAKVLPKDTIVITARGTVGELRLLGQPMAFNQSCYGLVSKDNIDNMYLFYALKYITDSIKSASYGTVFDTITKKTFDLLEIPYPSYEEQIKISSILDSLDRKIELNQKMNTTLEEMAMTLYKHWFVDFGPFQDGEFVESELGMIPKGWKAKKLGDLYDTSSGGTPSRRKTEYYQDGTINWLKTKELNDNFIFETEEKITELGLENSSAKVFPKNTVIIAMYGATVGKLGILSEPSSTNQACCAVIEKNQSFSYVLVYLYLLFNRTKIVGLANGGAQQNINQQIIRDLPIVVPTEKALNIIQPKLLELFELIRTNEQENRYLINLRDYLLPRLLSGEIDVSQAEKQVEEVL